MRSHLVVSSSLLLLSLAAVGCGGAYDSDPLGSAESDLSSCAALVVKNSEKADFASGVATNAPPVAGQPDVCASFGVKCVKFDLKIDLPQNVWHKPGGVQVAIRWASDLNALNLYVFRNGVEVGRAEGFLAAFSESLLLRNAEDGHYQVYVALDAVNSAEPSVPFEATARVQFDPAVRPIRPLLPDFAMRAQSSLTFDTPVFPFFGDEADPGDSCYHLEKSEDGAKTCMRFDQTFANVGEGAAELHFKIPKNPADTSTDVFARTYFSDGPQHFVDSPAGNWEFHEAHQHFHYENFVVSDLWATDSRGRHAGSAPLRAGRKVSFCLEDEGIDPQKWGKKGVGPRFYKAPDCLVFAAEDVDFNYIIQGLTPGWDDVYQWYLPGQYIDVDGVPDGVYILQSTADPDNKLVESDETNNCGTVLVRLTNVANSARHAEIIGPGPRCKH
jgi:hypothetical protein